MDERDLKRFINIPTLTTERLKLRRLTPRDAEDVYSYASDPRVPLYLLWDAHRSLSDTKRYLAEVDRKYKRGSYYDWGVVYGGRVIGTVGFTRFSCIDNLGEVGFVMHRDFWGRGLGAEAVRAVIKYGFETLLLNRIEARYLPENLASRRVTEKCGMTYEGTFRKAIAVKGEYRDLSVIAILSDEYFEKL